MPPQKDPLTPKSLIAAARRLAKRYRGIQKDSDNPSDLDEVTEALVSLFAGPREREKERAKP